MATIVSVSPYTGLPVVYQFSPLQLRCVQHTLTTLGVSSTVAQDSITLLIDTIHQIHKSDVTKAALAAMRDRAPLIAASDIELPLDVVKLIALHLNITGHPMINLTCKALRPNRLFNKLLQYVPELLREMLLYVNVTASNELMLAQTTVALCRSDMLNVEISQIDAMADNLVHNMLRAHFFKNGLLSCETFGQRVAEAVNKVLETKVPPVRIIDNTAVRDFRRNRFVTNAFVQHWVPVIQSRFSENRHSYATVEHCMLNSTHVIRTAADYPNKAVVCFTTDRLIVVPCKAYGYFTNGALVRQHTEMGDGTLAQAVRLLHATVDAINHKHGKRLLKRMGHYTIVVTSTQDIIPFLEVVGRIFNIPVPDNISFTDADYMSTDITALPYRDIPLLFGDADAIMASLPVLRNPVDYGLQLPLQCLFYGNQLILNNLHHDTSLTRARRLEPAHIIISPVTGKPIPDEIPAELLAPPQGFVAQLMAQQNPFAHPMAQQNPFAHPMAQQNPFAHPMAQQLVFGPPQGQQLVFGPPQVLPGQPPQAVFGQPHGPVPQPPPGA